MSEGWPSAAVADVLPAVAPAETPEAFAARRETEIRTWLGMKASATLAVDSERAMRTTVTATCFPVPTKGTQRIDLGNGYKLKLVYKLTHKLGNADATNEAGEKILIRTQIQALEDAIIEKHGDIGEALLKRLIKWTPELSATEYDKLDKSNNVEADIAATISELLTIAPATPSLEFEEPKEK